MRLSAQGDLIGFLVHFTRPEPALAIHGTVVKSDLPPGALRKQLYHVKLASKIFQLVMPTPLGARENCRLRLSISIVPFFSSTNAIPRVVAAM